MSEETVEGQTPPYACQLSSGWQEEGSAETRRFALGFFGLVASLGCRARCLVDISALDPSSLKHKLDRARLERSPERYAGELQGTERGAQLH